MLEIWNPMSKKIMKNKILLDEWEEMGEDEDPEVYEYVKKKTI